MDLFIKVVNMQRILTKVPVTPERVLKIYQRENFKDNFVSSLSNDYTPTPIAKKYL